VIAALRAKPEIARRLSQVDVSDLHNASVILAGDSAVIELGEDQFLPRLQSYLELASALRERVPDIDYVDLRFDERIYVRPASAPGALQRDTPAAKELGSKK
jgi:cell division septal protein FtsQ